MFFVSTDGFIESYVRPLVSIDGNYSLVITTATVAATSGLTITEGLEMVTRGPEWPKPPKPPPFISILGFLRGQHPWSFCFVACIWPLPTNSMITPTFSPYLFLTLVIKFYIICLFSHHPIRIINCPNIELLYQNWARKKITNFHLSWNSKLGEITISVVQFHLVHFRVQVLTWWWSKSHSGLIGAKGLCIEFVGNSSHSGVVTGWFICCLGDP